MPGGTLRPSAPLQLAGLMKVAAPFAIKAREDRFAALGFRKAKTFKLMSAIHMTDETFDRVVRRHGVCRFLIMHELNGFWMLMLLKDGVMKQI